MSKTEILAWAEQYHWPRMFVAGDCMIQPGRVGWMEFMDIRFDVWCAALVERIQQLEKRWQQQEGV